MLHEQVIRRYGGPPGILHPELIEAAAARPWAEFFGHVVYPAPLQKAAALMEAICQYHAFMKGNKRTALAATEVLLEEFDYELVATEDDARDTALSVTKHEMTMDELVEWLERNTYYQFHLPMWPSDNPWER